LLASAQLAELGSMSNTPQLSLRDFAAQLKLPLRFDDCVTKR